MVAVLMHADNTPLHVIYRNATFECQRSVVVETVHNWAAVQVPLARNHPVGALIQRRRTAYIVEVSPNTLLMPLLPFPIGRSRDA